MFQTINAMSSRKQWDIFLFCESIFLFLSATDVIGRLVMDLDLNPRTKYSIEFAVEYLTRTPVPEDKQTDEEKQEDDCREDLRDNLYQPVFESDESYGDEGSAIKDLDNNDLNIFQADEIEDVCNEAEKMVQDVNAIFFESHKLRLKDLSEEYAIIPRKDLVIKERQGGVEEEGAIMLRQEEGDKKGTINERQEEGEKEGANKERQEGVEREDGIKERQEEVEKEGAIKDRQEEGEKEGGGVTEKHQNQSLHEGEVLMEVLNENNNNIVEPPRKKRKPRLSSEEKKSRDKENHPIFARPCNHADKRKCNEIDEGTREYIHSEFWRNTYEARSSWIRSMVSTSAPNRRRKFTKDQVDRNYSRIYSLPNGKNESVPVCQKMFLSTLGYTSDKVIISVLKKSAGKLIPSPDKRGKHVPSNKLHCNIEQQIRDHIMLYNPCVSHYRRAHAPNRLYISPMYSSRKMHADFVESHDGECTVSHTRYFQEIKRMNIGFVKLGDEECETCDLHDRHLIDVHGLEEENERSQIVDNEEKKYEKVFFPNCCECSAYEIHINFAKKGRINYRDDRDCEADLDEEKMYSADLQKVIMLPVMPGLKKAIFCKRIVMFNETFAPLGGKRNGKATGVIWHEGIRGRTGQDVASVFVTFLRKQEEAKYVTIWLDNCSAQGKNWWLYTALVQEVNRSYGNLDSICLKYFEPGHTFMSADSFHHLVEKGIKKKRKLENFEDFVKIVEDEGKALEMKYDDFILIPRGVSQGNYAKNKPRLENVRIVKFYKGSFKIHWKSDYDEVRFSSAEFLQRKIEKSIKSGFLFPPQCQPRGVNTQKIENIIQVLCPHMEPGKRRFWLNIKKSDDSPDLQIERDIFEVQEDAD